MSDRMRPISFEKMVTWITTELRDNESIFGVHKSKFYRNNSGKSVELLGEKVAMPLGPAAGPNSQLAQNIVSAYLTGSRFIELKTVQVIDGEDLKVSKPCIRAEDECYNVEWSTELKVTEAYNEYVKAWFLLHVLMKELNLSDERDFMFNMSVGYDLKGIKSPKIDDYIEGMKNASDTKIWNKCREILISQMDSFSNFNKRDLDKISPVISPSIALSTLHGCPPEEIERIVNYLLEEKNIHTFIKMNPTLLGERFVRDTFDQMGYDYIVLNRHHFILDLQYKDAVKMLKRLKAVAKNVNLEIGVKLTNTLPVKILNNELPGEEMYLSGRALFPLSISLASRLAKEFHGDLQISYSGGADFFNVDKLLATGIQPVTFVTNILKPGGYGRINQMAKKVEGQLTGSFSAINTGLLDELAKEALEDEYYCKNMGKGERKKVSSKRSADDCSSIGPVCLNEEQKKCLQCSDTCELCVGVCPNRANVAINLEGKGVSSHRVIHLDGICNECGNCAGFCARTGKPYKDKITVFWTEEDFKDSTNKGFLVLDNKKGLCKVRKEDGKIVSYIVGQANTISEEMESVIKSCINKYSYMI